MRDFGAAQIFAACEACLRPRISLAVKSARADEWDRGSPSLSPRRNLPSACATGW